MPASVRVAPLAEFCLTTARSPLIITKTGLLLHIVFFSRGDYMPDSGSSSRKDTGRGLEGENGLQAVLSQAQIETRKQLTEAIEKQRATGRNLMDILRQDVDREMFGKIWKFLQGPSGKGKSRPVKDILFEGGWLTPGELEEAQRSGEAYDPELGRYLVDGGYINEEQLQEALAAQERSGQSFWRILVNQGLVSPKQIADARKYGAVRKTPAPGEDTLCRKLVKTGLVDESDCEAAAVESRNTGRTIPQILIDRKVVKKPELGDALAKEMGVSWIDLAKESLDTEAVELIPEHLARQNLMLPVSVKEDGSVQMAMVDPENIPGLESFQMLLNKELHPLLAFEQDLLSAIDKHYGPETRKERGGASAPALERLKSRLKSVSAVDEGVASLAEDAGVVDLVASILEGAINSRATDIHLESQMGALRVRYRIDGILYDIMNLPGDLREAVMSRIKVLSSMDITERRAPQDGHFTISAGEDREFNIRAATLPAVTGEKMVLRLLNPEDLFRGLRELGLETEQLDVLNATIKRPHGMILTSGPIGSGKTTTLYALLSEVDILANNVVTIEDPVEYQLPGINQVQVDTRTERTFAKMLRSVLRQDADVLMVGEIRDSETARVAIGAARTGHLVLSTMHADDSAGAIETLRQHGVPPFLITGSVSTVIAQRLVRKLCPECREPYSPEPEVFGSIGLDPEVAQGWIFYNAKGCKACYQLGYRGRTGIYEVLRMTPALRDGVLKGDAHDVIVKKAVAEGMITLLDAGIGKLKDGITTIEEVLRVTRVESVRKV